VGAYEIYCTLKIGEKEAVTCWKEVPFLPTLHAVQAIIKPGSQLIVLPKLTQWMKKEMMEGVLKAGGFSKVEVYEEVLMRQRRDLRIIL
jgi:hypothetical protein